MATEKMPAKLTILWCALLMPGLAVSQAKAQGFIVSKSETDVVEYGRNQVMGAIRLDYRGSGGDIDDGRTIKVSYGRLYLTGGGELLCGGTFNTSDTQETADTSCDIGVAATFANHKDTGVGTVTIALGTARPDANQFAFVVLRGVRADVSRLSFGNRIVASINSSTAPTGFVPIGQERTESLGGRVSIVKDGINVAIGQASRLLCNLGTITDDMGTPETDDDVEVPIGGVPSITVSEGFAKAWEDGDQTGIGSTMVTIEMNNLPEGTSLRWPHGVNFMDPDEDASPRNRWSTLTLTDASRRTAGQVDETNRRGAGQEQVDGEDVAADNGETVTYIYAATAEGRTGAGDKDVTTESDSFKIEFEVHVADLDKVGAGGISDIRAWLGPAGKSGDDDDRDSVLSYLKMPDTDPAATDPDGRILDFAQCVTYLLFPHLHCGAYPNWTTAIAIANTTRDDGVFGLSGGAVEQSGSVMLHAFPRSIPTFDGSSGRVPEAMAMEVSSGLAAGDTLSFDCSQGMLAGFEGYAIARAGFRHAHGMALVLGMFNGGADIDLAHGYLALVIPDPEFGGQRAPASGETLGH